MEITLQEIRQAFNVLLSDLERTRGSTLEIEDSYYWSIPQAERYRIDQTPDVELLGVGDLFDDIQETKAIANGNNDPTPQGLVWLSAVLTRIGEQGYLASGTE